MVKYTRIAGINYGTFNYYIFLRFFDGMHALFNE